MHKRGIALVTVLLAASLLAMLTTALVMVSRGNLVSGEQYRRREALMKTCYSGLDYARARLAQVKSWGKPPISAGRILDDANLQIDEAGADEASFLVQGTVKSNQATFRVQVLNNLKGLGQVDPPAWSRTRVKIPAHCALVLVESEFEGLQKHFEVVLSKGSVLTNAVSADGDFAAKLSAGSSGLKFASTKPRSNALKVRGDIYLPDPGAVNFDAPGPKGNVLGRDVNVSWTPTVGFDSSNNLIPGGGTSLRGNDTATSDASSRMNANIKLGVGPSNNFNPSQLKQPVGPVNDIDPGEYTFTGPEQVTYRSPSGTSAVYFGEIPGKVKFHEFRFMPQGNARVTGDLKITGVVTRVSYPPPPGPLSVGTVLSPTRPEPVDTTVSLGIGYNSTGIPKGSDEGKDRLTVTGNITVSGDLVGNGQIFVNKSSAGGGELKVVGNSLLSATRTDGMAVVTEGNAEFSEIGNSNQASPALMDQKDLGYFTRAIRSQHPVSGSGGGPSSAATLDAFHNATTGERIELAGRQDQLGGDGMRNQPISSAAGYLTDHGGFQTSSPSNQPLSAIQVTVSNPGYIPGAPGAAGSPTMIKFAQAAVGDYIKSIVGPDPANPKPLTLGQHLRIREFVKSVEFGRTRSELIDPDNTSGYSAADDEIQSALINQVQAYDQDALGSRLGLMDWLEAQVVPENTYTPVMRKDLIFGGILYSAQNVFTSVDRGFSLIGSLIARGNIGFDRITSAQFLFDPSLVEDQFEIGQLGLVPLFFWTD